MLTFNRIAATLLRQRLHALVDRDAYGVTIQTYHSLALRMTGHSLQEIQTRGEDIELDFDAAIRETIALLKGDKELFGTEPDNVRDRLLAGYRHILVDEYQDIDTLQYELISAIAGRTLDDKDSKLTLLAVGDDDQNIYQFRGANIGFIKQFQDDYEAETYYLTENYRSSKHIIDTANQLIQANQDRMKTKHPIVINKDRDNLLPGGDWEQRDLLAKGRVQVLETSDFNPTGQANVILAEMLRLKALSPEWNWNHVAVLAREWVILHPIRNLCDQLGIPTCRYFPSPPPLFRIREINQFLATMKSVKDEWLSTAELDDLLSCQQTDTRQNPWWDLLATIRQNWQQEAGQMQQPATRIIDYYYESLMAYKLNRQFGKGLLLSTVHSAKGMEYQHVFIPDGGWDKYKNRTEEEEARRLYYVAMTRAQKTLTLISNQQKPNPLLHALEGNCIVKRKTQAAKASTGQASNEQIEILDLRDVDLGYAGRFEQKHPIHKALQQLQPADQLRLVEASGELFLLSEDTRIVRFSKQATKQWKDRLKRIRRIEVIAMVQRQCADSEPEYQKWYRVDTWEVPLIEIRYDRFG